MTSQQIAMVAPSGFLIAVMLVQFVVSIRRDRVARRLFMSETGGSRADFDGLPPSKQRLWSERVREDKELAKFEADFKKRRSK